MRLAWFVVGLVSLSSALVSSAWANTQATASVSNLTFTLYDLKPEDGIAPSLKFVPVANELGSTAMHASLADDSLRENSAEYLKRVKPYMAHTSGAELAVGQAYATVLPYEVAAFGQAAGGHTTFDASVDASYGLRGNRLVGIELSANTLMVVHADLAASGSVSQTPCELIPGSTYSCFYVDRSTAYAWIDMYFACALDGCVNGNEVTDYVSGSVTNFDAESIYDPIAQAWVYSPKSTPRSFNETKELSRSLTNSTSLPQYGMLSMHASVEGSSNTGVTGPLVAPSIPFMPDDAVVSSSLQLIGETADGGKVFGVITSVPEPGTWATMGLGLLGLAAVKRRRQRQA